MHTWINALRAVTSLYSLNTPRAALLRILPKIPDHYGPFRGKDQIRYSGYWSTDDEVCRSLFWFGDFDPWVNEVLRRFARPGSAVLDVGANIGATAVVLARAVGPEGRVFCFEPVAPNLERLRRNIESNELSQVEVLPFGLSDRRCDLRMTVPKGHAGSASVAHDGSDAGLPFHAMSLDDWLAERPGLAISVCKIDVEGHERAVFEGMRRTLTVGTIPAFVFERHVEPDVYSDPVFDLLRIHGYRLLRIDKGLATVHFVPVGEAPRARPTRDFVAVLVGTDAERRALSGSRRGGSA